MKLDSITVQNFRSITEARKIPISDITTLVGANNEGKSNILLALGKSMSALVMGRVPRLSRTTSTISRRRRERSSAYYEWEQDFPLRLQRKSPEGRSEITLEFRLSEEEKVEFRRTIGSSINEMLPLTIAFGSQNDVEITVRKPGKGAKSLTEKSRRIADFVASKIRIQYIPAVRTATSAREIVSSLVEAELASLEDDPSYDEAVSKIAELQAPILKRLSDNITSTMREFLPNIKGIRVTVEDSRRLSALRDVAEILIDDGVETNLGAKGDGVQSLAALALMRHASKSDDHGRDVVIALEEPESHLHPSAIRQLRNVLIELSTRYQVVITTHNPIFANRDSVHKNIIVSKSRAASAENLRDVREALGVRLDDNLMGAEVVLIVEGEEDRIALSSIISDLDPVIANALRDGRLVFDVLSGATNLRHRVRMHSEAVTRVHVFLDHDSAGHGAADVAIRAGAIEAASVNFAVVSGRQESELEDLYSINVYDSILREDAGIEYNDKMADYKHKWSKRIATMMKKGGKISDDALLQSIKIKVARSAANLGKLAINPGKMEPIKNLTVALCEKLRRS